MSSPGEIEHVPLKVVPIYIEPLAEIEPDQIGPEQVRPEQGQPEPGPPVAPRRTTALIGILALVLAVAAAALQAVAIVVASSGDFPLGTLLAYLAIGVSVLGVVGGVVAVILRRGTRIGAAAMVLGILANPIVLLALLRLVSGAQTS